MTEEAMEEGEALALLLRELQVEYVAELPGVLVELRGAVERWRAAPEDAGTLREATTHAHRIAGTAGSYELRALSLAARELEELFLAVQRGAISTSDARPRASELLEGVERVPLMSG